MDTIKDRSSMNLREAEDIKKRWQEYTKELYKKKIFNDPDNDNGVITHLEPDILESEVRWALGSITTNKARLDEAQAGIKIARRTINNLRYADDTTLIWQKVKRN